MADPLAQLTRFPWGSQQDETGNDQGPGGFFTMPLGTYKYLFPSGLQGSANGEVFTTYEQIEKTYSRALYYGGPTVTMNRKAKTVRRTRSIPSSTALSDKKLVLVQADGDSQTQSTVHYTGETASAVAWLKANVAAITSGSISVRGAKGQSYITVDQNSAA